MGISARAALLYGFSARFRDMTPPDRFFRGLAGWAGIVLLLWWLASHENPLQRR